MTLEQVYRKFRKYSPFILVGRNAEQALNAARVYLRWHELESEGQVRIRVIPDDSPDASFYDDWGHISERTRNALKEAYYDSCVGVITQYKVDGEWVDADSIWGNAGYDNAASPFENCYVIDLMEAAVYQADALMFDSVLSI